jgi:hypothetical protein
MRVGYYGPHRKRERQAIRRVTKRPIDCGPGLGVNDRFLINSIASVIIEYPNGIRPQ